MTNGARNEGWFANNWKWAVPVGCLGAMVLFAAFFAAIILVVFGAMRSSDAYQIAVARSLEDSAVAEALGEPVEPGWFVSGNINVNGPAGEAELSIPLTGSRGSGTLYVIADKVAGEWSFQTMEVAIDGSGERVNLLTEPELGDNE